MEPYSIRQSALALMRSAPAVVLTTLDARGFPWTRAMLNLWNRSQYPSLQKALSRGEDALLVYFTTNTSSGKVRDIERNSRVAVYYHRPEEWWGLMLSGTAHAVHDPELKQEFWQPDWNLYYPKGATDEDYTLLEFRPDAGQLYEKLHSQSIFFPDQGERNSIP